MNSFENKQNLTISFGYHAVFTDLSSNTVDAIGDNKYVPINFFHIQKGQLGSQASVFSPYLRRVMFATQNEVQIVQVEVGSLHTLFLVVEMNVRKLYATGNNGNTIK